MLDRRWIAGCAVVAMTAAAVHGCQRDGQESSGGWKVTTYYTAVESLHQDDPRQVTGCPKLECDNGHDDLGSYPADFVQAVQDEGAGRITTGPHAGRYLNWSSGSGYWLDTAARDTHGRPLRPFVTAAADGFPDGTPIRLAGCGRQEDGTTVPATICRRLSLARWKILDAFTPGLGGKRHVDLYLGEETGPDFTSAPIYTTLVDADVRTGAGK
ncbi:hypothetical protein [Fodinicola feengrottensis]|uniref:Uncharacterized protein n=1 Tax=Fodinicola feengrottensis TaxID=435914 RepID=A0ABN2I189_9ACTN|nr:hypothetical protein [Fodinicola feengrottensis]